MPTRREELKARGHPIFLTYKFCCITYLMVIYLTFGTLVIFNPSFYIDNFYVPSLNKFINSTAVAGGGADSLIFFDLKIQNDMVNVGVHYDAVNLTFSYGTNTSSSSMVIGTYTVAGFYQGMEKTAQRRDVVIVSSSLPWKEAAMRAVSGGSTAEFRVDVVTDVKLKNLFWYFKEKRITAGGRVEVDDLGKKVGRESVELQSGAPPPSTLVIMLWIAGFLVILLVGTVIIAVGVLWVCSLFYP